jgi:purine-nucleoside/S-methyl-5'-thioadenosine phosphorylase / adenosine deaminase
VTATLPAVEAPFRWRTSNSGEGEVPWIEARLPGAVAAFTTRLGGVSRGDYAELNLGILTDDDQALVTRNREIVADALDRQPEGFAMARQVHGTDVQVHNAKPRPSAYVTRVPALVEADGHVTGLPDVTPLVLVADCLPLVMTAPGAVAAIHCGWRGVAAGIVPLAVERLCEVSGATPSHVTAALGPGIGVCCYEVGEEVITAFRKRAVDVAMKGSHLDISEAIRLELQRAGVDASAFADVSICTSCNPDLFFSHRRDGPTGRQAGIAWLN